MYHSGIQLPRPIFQYLKIFYNATFRTNSSYKMYIQLFNRLIGGVWELFMILKW